MPGNTEDNSLHKTNDVRENVREITNQAIDMMKRRREGEREEQRRREKNRKVCIHEESGDDDQVHFIVGFTCFRKQ